MSEINISSDEMILAYGEVCLQRRLVEHQLDVANAEIKRLKQELDFYDDKLWKESVTPLDTD
jgi:hypothetical protein|tara:strand:- start:326 stop:511 length:186 start_codon:yes stop_codon:yes gene_type:complete